jgi:hypothetical protein
MKGSSVENLKTIEFKQNISGTRIGRITDITEQGQVFVDFDGNQFGPLSAKFAGSMQFKLRKIFEAASHKVLLVFEDDNLRIPIIIDTVSDTIDKTPENDSIVFRVDDAENVLIDGRKFTFDAKEQIVLRCGKSSITLTRTGKVLIKGAYLLNRSSGINLIKGASVKLN